MKFTENYLDKLQNEIQTADAILIGAGAGMSAAAGLDYDGTRFETYFSDFQQKYGISDMYSGGFYPFETLEEYWTWWSRHIYINRYCVNIGKPYLNLLKMVQNKNYFILTTNVDHQFQLAGFDKTRLFYTQGDYGLWQCSSACHNKTYDNKDAVYNMVKEQKNMKIPSELIPKCPVCGKPMTMNLRCDDLFVQDRGWYAAKKRYDDFLSHYQDSHILYLELGVGINTPAIIKYPFWQLTEKNQNAVYICINPKECFCPETIRQRAVCINAGIEKIL